MELNKKHMGLNRKYYFNTSCFKVIDTEEKAYWLGYLMADGHVRCRKGGNSFCLTSIDYDHLEKFKSFLEHPSDIKLHNNNCYRFEVYSNEVTTDLIKLGIVPRKSFCASIPNIETPLLRHFIRGVFDGDGNIGFYGDCWRMSVVSATKSFIYELKTIINDFGVKANSIQKKDSVYAIVCGGNNIAHSFGKFLYENSTIYLERKYAKFLDMCAYIENPVVLDIINIFKPCSIGGCNKILYAKDLCRYHYDQKRYYERN